MAEKAVIRLAPVGLVAAGPGEEMAEALEELEVGVVEGPGLRLAVAAVVEVAKVPKVERAESAAAVVVVAKGLLVEVGDPVL